MEDDPGRDDSNYEPDELAMPHTGGPGGNVSLTGRVQRGEPEQYQRQADRDQLAIHCGSSHGSVAWGTESGTAARAAAESGLSSMGRAALSAEVTDSSCSAPNFTGVAASGPRMQRRRV